MLCIINKFIYLFFLGFVFSSIHKAQLLQHLSGNSVEVPASSAAQFSATILMWLNNLHSLKLL